MTDLTDTIIPKSDQINADDLIGHTMTIKITGVSRCKEPEQPIAINFEGDNGKPYKPGKSMRRVLVNVWGPDGATYVGRSLTLYRDDEVVFGGLKVGGIRISNMSHISKNITMALTATRASRKPFTVKPLAIVQEQPTEPSDPALEKYPTLFEADGRKWMTNLKAVLASALTLEEIAAIEAVSSVSGALANAPPAVKSEIRSMLAGAKARVTPPTGMPDFANAPEHDAA